MTSDHVDKRYKFDTAQEEIDDLERMFSRWPDKWGDERYASERRKRALRHAINALISSTIEKQTMRVSLTIKQAMAVLADITEYPPYVYIEERYGIGYWADADRFFELVHNQRILEAHRTWRPWLKRPSEEERAAAKWEEAQQ